MRLISNTRTRIAASLLVIVITLLLCVGARAGEFEEISIPAGAATHRLTSQNTTPLCLRSPRTATVGKKQPSRLPGRTCAYGGMAARQPQVSDIYCRTGHFSY